MNAASRGVISCRRDEGLEKKAEHPDEFDFASTTKKTSHSVGPRTRIATYRTERPQIVVGLSSSTATNRKVSGNCRREQQQQQGDCALEPSCKGRNDHMDISLNDTGKWPFPFLNEDLCCYYDSDNAKDESCELPLGVQQEQKMDDCLNQVSHSSSPFLGTRWSAVTKISYLDSYSLLKFIYQFLKQQRNLIMVGCVVAIAVFSSSALVDRSGGQRQVALSVTTDADDKNIRMKMIMKNILDSNVSVDSAFDDKNSPQSQALEWISNKDPMHLMPTDDDLLQRYACAVFYFSINNATEVILVEQDNQQHETFKNWLTQTSVCEWSGVSCENGDGNITSFIVRTAGNTIQGQLVREIMVALPELQILHLNNLGLKKELPSEIGLLSKLKVLSLGNNELSGNVPKSLGQLNQLKLLGLQNNLFQNEIPREIWKLKELSALYLDGNRLTGTIPTEVKNLKKMIDLRLRDNRMKGSLPSSLGSLTGLRILYLDNNNFNGTIPREIGSMLELVSLTLHENKFVTSLPKDLGNLANLKHLILSNNTLTGSIPENVLRLPSLGYLWLDHNYFVGNITNQTCKTMSDDIDLRIDYHAITCDCCEHRTIDN